MDFIANSSMWCAKQLVTKVPNTIYPSVEDQIDVYSYGFMVVIGSLVKTTSLVILALVLGILIPSLVIVATFSSFRILAGGYHLKTAERCLIVSLIQFIGSALIVQYTQKYWTYINIYSLFIFCVVIALYIIIKYVPRDTPNKPITDKLQVKKFKRWSFTYLLVWISIMIVFTLLNVKIIVIASCFGLLLELFSISKLGQKIYKKLDTPNILIIK